MLHPLIPLFIYVHLCAKGLRVQLLFSPLVNNRSEFPVERSAFGIRFDKVLVYLGPHTFKYIPSSPEQGEIPLDSMPGLKHIVYPHQDQGTDDNKRPEYRWPEPRYTAKDQSNGNTMNDKFSTYWIL